jgi:Ca2+/H+ antiporter
MSVSWLFIFVPVAAALERIAPSAYTWVFFSAWLAIIPIAHLIVESTEHLSVYTGDAIGGLLNAIFGNAPELIIAMVAPRVSAIAMARKNRWTSVWELRSAVVFRSRSSSLPCWCSQAMWSRRVRSSFPSAELSWAQWF